MTEHARELVETLDTGEQVSLLAGIDYWHTAPLERIGLASMHLSDGPVGVRGERTVGSVSVSFPCGTAIGATFDPEAAAELADVLADECADKGVDVLLGPTVNLQRHPLGGRHFECYSEDPTLSAELAVAYVRALQARGVGATVKHLVANDTEFERHTVSAEVDDDVLRRLYLVPFEEAVRRGGAFAVMSAYNRVNGTYAAEHAYLLSEVLRGEWGFDGLVVSDWFGTRSTVPSLEAGLDLEMPGPGTHYGEALARAVAAGEVAPGTVAERAYRVVQLALRTGATTGSPCRVPRRSLPERREVSRRLAASSFVLLRNEAPAGADGPLLPLGLGPGQTLAVIGPKAAATEAQGGGSAQVHPERTISALDGLSERYEPLGVEVSHAVGCVAWARTPALEIPLELEYHPAGDGGAVVFDGAPAHREQTPRPPLVWLGRPVPGVPALVEGAFGVRCSGRLLAGHTGEHELTLVQVGSARLLLDGAAVLEGSRERGTAFFGFGSTPATTTVLLEAGRTYDLVVEYEVAPGSAVAGLSLGMRPPLPPEAELIRQAAEVAAAADVAVVVVGTGPEWETEGHDRADMSLPGRQDDLVRAVASANPRTVVVLNCGAPVTMDWEERCPAVLQAWFPGEQAGRALADVLSGDEEPGGRLPHCVPARLEDSPAHPHYPGAEGRLPYGEGLLVGHRHYATAGVAPRYWFGHGLGYTAFELSEPTAGSSHDGVVAAATVANRGGRAGRAVLQAYLRPLERADGEPSLEYAGSRGVDLGPGKRVRVEVTVAGSRLGRCRPGAYDVLVGWSADPARLSLAGTVTIAG